ncbi:MAG: hypothetical protein ACXAC8_02505 [Candidatus Hodarchaeales archaeon]|jgi:hypothetical protein
MIQNINAILKHNKPNTEIIAHKEQYQNDLFDLNEKNYVFGYTASLLYIMNGFAKAVFVLGSLTKRKYEILMNSCHQASIPLIKLRPPDDEYVEGKIFTAVDSFSLESR